MRELHQRYAPFVRGDAYGPMGCTVPVREKLRLALVWMTLLPLLKAAVCLATLCSFAVVCTAARRLPYAVQRRLTPPLAWLHVRTVLLCCGFTWIRRTRLGGPSKAVPVCLVSNHVSWLDILVAMAESFPSFVAKATIRKLPLVGVISEAMGCIFVERETRGAGENGAGAAVRDRLLRRERDPASCPQLLLFPEGTTTNGKYLLPFKTGAFLTGAPVQPVLLRYSWRRFSPAWETITAARHFFLTFSQLHQSLEVVYLPVYEPNAAEKADPALYAAGVRAAMLRAGGLEASPLTLADKRAYQAALLEDWTASQTKKTA
jgi:lysophosphatidylcholine acyltransferase/lyso-PAF acetyltransferase